MLGLVIAGTHSGCGKTTITLGIMAALKKKGLMVQSFKAGPDFIDSGLHRVITGRHSRNLDMWICGEKYVKDCFYKYSADADIAVVEGVMGMYDGEYNTANLAQTLGLPIILVVDAYGMAESAGAVVKGFLDFGIRIAEYEKSKIVGVIFNRVASDRHYERLKNSVRDVEVLGYLPRDLDFEIPHRHLGLTVAEENPIADKNMAKLADAVLKYINMDWLSNCGMRNAECEMRPASGGFAEAENPKSEIKIAVAYDRVFCFYYEDNLDLLRDAGAEIITFSPLSDNKIPHGVDAVYVGGGYPELYAGELSKNVSMLKSLKEWSDAGKPIYAECGGLMYLSKGIYAFEGKFFEMAGVFSFETEMKKGRSHLGYREILLKENCILGREGDKLKGHEFHYSQIRNSTGTNAEERLKLAYLVANGSGKELQPEGYLKRNALASYIHVHFGSNLSTAKKFMEFIKER